MHKIKSLKDLISRVGSVVLLVVMFATVADAYTIVMRGGRRVEVPSTFVLTHSTLTYEVSSSVQITLPVAAIDIPATEQANGEASGSFMQRVLKSDSQAHENRPVRSSSQTRTITNRDLESVAKRRLDSEHAYEIRRKQLQLPSVAESRAKAAAESAAISLELEQRRIAQNESENYWRQRASELRTEMADVDAELEFVRMKLEEGWAGWGGGWSSLSGSNTGFISGFPSIGFGRWQTGNRFGRGRFHGAGRHYQNIYVAPRNGGASRGHFGVHGGTRARGFINSGVARPGAAFGLNPFSVFPNVGVIGVGAPAFDYSYERSELITRFNELGGERAALRARWRELEEEARRAGTPPGWLRP